MFPDLITKLIYYHPSQSTIIDDRSARRSLPTNDDSDGDHSNPDSGLVGKPPTGVDFENFVRKDYHAVLRMSMSIVTLTTTCAAVTLIQSNFS